MDNLVESTASAKETGWMQQSINETIAPRQNFESGTLCAGITSSELAICDFPT
jgi:hypothetical protein